MDKCSGVGGSSCSESTKVISSIQSQMNQKSESIRVPKLQTQKNARDKFSHNLAMIPSIFDEIILEKRNFEIFFYLFSLGHIEINYVDRMGNSIVVQNTSASNKNDQKMTGWSIKKTIDEKHKNKFLYEFPDNFILKNRVPVRILARNTSKKSLATTTKVGMISLVADNIVT